MSGTKPVEDWIVAASELREADLRLRQLIEDICCGQRDKERLYDAGTRLYRAGNAYAEKTAAKVRAIYEPMNDRGALARLEKAVRNESQQGGAA